MTANLCRNWPSSPDRSVCGGLGEAVCRLLAAEGPAPVELVGVYDAYGETGSLEQLIPRLHLAPKDIAAAAMRAVERKKTHRP